ncbi:hypothetical protein FHS89_001816 [Rubricella aquisinus]|uniref:Uncharacterized protein n=1 Tax=Rubricella aquisinus TaxID=2028108 RepID=A0A840X1Q7_9RHOB|nr:hypothetical protein [Rubricella aquisinus]
MPTQFADPKLRAIQNLLARDKVRLRNMQTGELLHMSGRGTTTDVNWAWIGFLHQAETLRIRANLSGSDWPFVAVHRDLLEWKVKLAHV